jgi:hypothetical protein
MSMSLTGNQQTPEEVAKLAGEILDKTVTHAVSIGHGGNSRVYRITADRDYVVKFYFQHPADLRDRLGTEFKSLSFLWEQGIRNIPQPLSSWPQQSCALYSMIEGKAAKETVSAKDIDTAADFLKTLKGFNAIGIAQGFKPASEAFFSGKDIVASLKTRLQRFGFHDAAPEYQALKTYLLEDFNLLLEEVAAWSKEYLAGYGISWEKALDPKYRTLSPSDFGFHNALRLPDGDLCFLDFEYFGWDDPVKMTSDFVWHPAMNLTEELKQQFAARMQQLFSDDPNYKIRRNALFPIFGLKWCLIILNEFTAMDAERRNFARPQIQDKTAVRLQQLARAKNMTETIRSTYKEFSYGS